MAGLVNDANSAPSAHRGRALARPVLTVVARNDDSAGSPVDQVLEQTGGEGADRGCECVGYQAHDPEAPNTPS